MTKRYNVQYFDAEINGEKYSFVAYTTNTRCGFCHTIECRSHNITNTKASYWNRTWEEWCYKSVLESAIAKFPKAIREDLTKVLIEKKTKEVTERCNEMVNAFKELHSSLSDESKEKLANSGIEMHSESDVHSVMGLMALTKMMEK